MKHNRRRSPGKPRVSPTVLDRLNPHVAGIDCGAADHFVAVPPDRDPTPVQSFRTFTSDLRRLAEWLTACGVRSVAMEATGVYWIPIYEILETAGFEVLLVNARHLKNVPGRKSDVSDCEWIRDLHSVGLLRASFRPTDAIVALRAYLRHRQTLVESASRYVQRMQKALVQMNLQLSLVVSDIMGVTGLRILRDIVAGHRDPQQLAEHRNYRCHASKTEIIAALTGHYRPEHLFALQQNLELFDVCQTQLAACDHAIEAHVQTLTSDRSHHAAPLPAPRVTKRPQHNEPRFEIRAPLYQLTGGIDLTQINGIAPYTALQLIAEIGTDMTPVGHGKALHLVAHARPQEQDLRRPAPQLADAAVGESCRRDSPTGRDEPQPHPDGPRCVLSPISRAHRQTASDHRHRTETRDPRVSRPQGRPHLPRSGR